MADIFQRLAQEGQSQPDVFQQLANQPKQPDVFQRLAQASVRNTAKIQTIDLYPETLGTSVPDVVGQKTVVDHIGDAAVDIAKGLVTAEQGVVGLLDLGLYAGRKTGEGFERIANAIAPDYVAEPENVKFGALAKQLDEGLGISFDSAKQYWEGFYSDERKKQQAELQTGYSQEQIDNFNKPWTDAYQTQGQVLTASGATPEQIAKFNKQFQDAHQKAFDGFINAKGMSMDKSVGENLQALGDKFGYVGDNPSLGVGAAIESAGYLIPSRAASKGVLMLEEAAAKRAAGAVTGSSPYAAAGIGEGLVTAATIADHARHNSADGLASDTEMAAALGAGALTGVIGGVASRGAARLGIGDIDSVALARNNLTQAATKLPQVLDNAPAKAVLSTASEAGQEFLQSIGESVLPNIAQGKDPLTGLDTDLALSTVAGGIMGAGVAAPNVAKATLDSLNETRQQVTEKAKDKFSNIPTGDLADPKSKHYNPVAAYQSYVADTQSPDTEVQQKARDDITGLVDSVTARRDNSTSQLKDLVDEVTSLKQEQAEIQQRKDAGDTSPELVEQEAEVTSLLQALEPNITALQSRADQASQDYLELQKAMEADERHTRTVEGDIQNTEELQANVESVINPVPVQVDEYGNTLDSDGDAVLVPESSAEHIIKYPSSYDADQLLSIANSTTPLFTPEQKQSLRELADYKVQQNVFKTPDDTHNDILNGFKGNSVRESHLGLRDYNELIFRGVRTGDSKLVETTLENLARFEENHSLKAQAVTQAWDMYKQDGTYSQVVRLDNGTWSINTDRNSFLGEQELKRNGGIAVTNRTRNLVGTIERESALITQAYHTLDSYAQNFQQGSAQSAAAPVTAPASTNVPAEPQPALNEQPAQSEAIPETPPSTEGMELVFDENGVGRLRPKQEDRIPYVKLTGNTKHTAKDQRKSEQATQFIGIGAPGSSTAQYALDWGDNANTGNYTQDDRVFISLNGDRNNRVSIQNSPDLKQNIDKAIAAGAIVIADNLTDRSRAFNIGERELAEYLTGNGYIEDGNTGIWSRQESQNEPVTPVVSTGDGIEVPEGETVLETVDLTPSPEAKIPALRQVSKESRTAERAKSVTDKDAPRNLLAAHFNQDSKGNKPLAQVKDYVTRIKDSVTAVAEQVIGKPATEQQVKQVEHFTGFSEKLSEIIQAIHKPKKAQYRFQDLTNFLGELQEDGKISFDENTLTSLSLAAYSWVIESGNTTAMSNKDISRMLGMDNDTYIPSAVAEKYRNLTSTRLYAVGKLGKSAVKYLGLKVTNDSDPKYQQRLENSVGTLVLFAMEDMGLVKSTAIPAHEVLKDLTLIGDVLSPLYNSLKKLPPNATLTFISPVTEQTDEGLKLNEQSQAIVDANTGTKGFLSKLFGDDVGYRRPLLEKPKEFTQGSINKTSSTVPSLEADNLTRAQANGFKIRGNVASVFKGLRDKDSKFLFRILGLDNSTEAINKLHISERESQQAKIGNDIKALNNAFDFMSEIEDGSTYQEFWDTQYVSANQRMYYNSNLFNVQANQIHRALAGLSAFEITFGTDVPAIDDKGNITEYGHFLRAVAEGMEGLEDTKFFQDRLPSYQSLTVDKVLGLDFIPVMEAYLEQPYVQQALQAMISVMDNPDSLTREYQDAIERVVNEWGMGVQSVHSLIELAGYAQAVLNETPFTTSVGLGSDGVTNGVAIASVLTGTLSSDSALQFGLISHANSESMKNYMDTKRNGVADYYQSLGAVLQSKWVELSSQYSPKVSESLNYLINSLENRKLSKAWAIPFNYNAGFARLKETLADAAIKTIYGKFTKISTAAIAAKKAGDRLAYNTQVQHVLEVQAHINNLLGSPIKLPAPEELIDYEFAYTDEMGLRNAINSTYGMAAEEATLDYAKRYINSRDINVAVHKAGFKVYEFLKKKVIQKVTTDLMAEGKLQKIKVTSQGAEVLYDGLSTEDQRRVDKALLNYTPIIQSALSRLSDNPLEGGLSLLEQGVSEDSINDEVDISHNIYGTKGTRNARITIQTPTQTDVGVKGWAMQVQSVDAAVSNITIGNIPAINVHDANISGISNAVKTANIQNKAFFNNTAFYRSQVEAVEMLTRTLEGIRDLAQEYDITQQEVDNLTTGLLASIKDKDVSLQAKDVRGVDIFNMLQRLSYSRYSAEMAKVAAYRNIYSVHQYAGESGEYVLTDADRKRLDKEYEELDKLRDSSLDTIKQLRNEVQAALSGQYTKGQNVHDTVVQANRNLTPLQRWLEQRKSAPIALKDLLGHLQGKGTDARSQVILNAIQGLLPDNLTVHYFDLNNLPKDIDTTGIDPVKDHGWFDPATDTIYIKSVSSMNSKVDEALVIHELLHGALAKRIWEVQDNPAAYPEAVEQIARLNELRKQVRNAYPNDSVLQGMLVSLDEFISYGLTEPRLQELMQGVVVDRAGRNKTSIKSLFKTFIDTIAGLLNLRARQITAFQAFVIDSAALIQSMDKVQPANLTIKFKSGEQSETAKRPVFNPLPSRHGFNASQQSAAMGTLDIMQQLPTGVSSEFNQHLDSVISGTIEHLYRNSPVTQATIDQIQPVNTSAAITAGFNLSEKEDVISQAVEAVMETYITEQVGSIVVSQLNKLYQVAQKKLTPADFHQGDWTTASIPEQELAERQYDYLFKLSPNQGKSGHLARFAGLALASEQVAGLMEFVPEHTTVANKTWFERITAIYNWAVAWLGNKLAGTYSSQTGNERLNTLVNRLTSLDIKARQNKVHILDKAWNSVGKVTDPLNKLGGKTAGLVFNRNLFLNSRFSLLRAAGKAARVSTSSQVSQIPGMVQELRNQMNPHQRLGEVAELMNEIISPGALKKVMEALVRATNFNGTIRQSIVDNTRKVILSSFEKSGKELTKDQHKAVTYSVLRTDLQALLGTYDVSDIQQMIEDSVVLANEISDLESVIEAVPNGNDMLTRTKMLGYYMVHGIAGKGFIGNAVGIASGVGTFYQGNTLTMNDPLVQQIDRLASMYALSYSNASHLDTTRQMLKSNPDSVMDLIGLHSNLVKDALDEFEDNPLSYTKGYMPEITNPYREIGFAMDAAQRRQMESEGWKYVGMLPQDSSDASPVKMLMVHSDRGYQRYVSGAIDLVNTGRKGTEVFNRRSPEMKRVVKQQISESQVRANQDYRKFDPRSQKAGLIPAYDNDGYVLAYRYQMANASRDAYLERNNNFADLLSSFAGGNYYKPANKVQHERVVKVLFDDYKTNYKKNPRAYISLDPNSSDPRIAEMWRMLPYDFRQEAVDTYGKGNPVVLRNDVFNMTFGFRKYSLAQAFDKNPTDRTRFEDFYVKNSRFLFGDSAQAVTARTGHIWQEIVKLAKDIIVIRGLQVMWGNIVSNIFMLMAQGVSPLQLMRDTRDALYNTRKYQDARNKLLQTEAKMRIHGNTAALMNELALAQDEMARNPLAQFIEAGMLSTIVEDVAVEQSDYSYKSETKERVDKWLKVIPSPVRTATSYALFSPGTQVYQFLASTTQLSDFIAKYSLYNKLRGDGMTFEQATSEASQTFINYDVPTSQGMQYANDMGLFMFTKFALRIQAVLFKLLDKKAASVIGQQLAVEHVTGMAGILDPLVFNRLGNNPFEAGAFSIFNAAGELPIINIIN